MSATVSVARPRTGSVMVTMPRVYSFPLVDPEPVAMPGPESVSVTQDTLAMDNSASLEIVKLETVL